MEDLLRKAPDVEHDQQEDERWWVYPLDETFQTKMVNVLFADEEFCQHCYVDDADYLLIGGAEIEKYYPNGIITDVEADNARKRAIYYIVESIIHDIAEGMLLFFNCFFKINLWQSMIFFTGKCAEIGPECTNKGRHRAENMNFRKPFDWYN